MVEENQKKPVSKTKLTLQIAVLALSFLLLVCYIATFFAGHVYIFELLSNFIVQYMLIAFLLGLLSIFVKSRIGMVLMFGLCLICFIQSRMVSDTPWQFFAPQEQASLKIATFNQNFANDNYEPIGEWLNKPNGPDVIIIIEATSKTKRAANRAKENYPHQILKHTVNPKHRPISYFILSKYPVFDHERITLSKKPRHNILVRFKVKPDGVKEPFTIYAIHTHSPVTAQNTVFRDTELEQIAAIIKEDKSKNIIAMGDFNTAPYSSHFKVFKEITGLHFQSYGLLLNPTWPSQFKFSFLQIPIDHVLYSDNLIQQNKKAGMPLFSDHHALIAEFSEKE